jgi:hypothetical protein
MTSTRPNASSLFRTESRFRTREENRIVVPTRAAATFSRKWFVRFLSLFIVLLSSSFHFVRCPPCLVLLDVPIQRQLQSVTFGKVKLMRWRPGSSVFEKAFKTLLLS